MKSKQVKPRLKQVGNRWVCEGLGIVGGRCYKLDMAYWTWAVIARSRGVGL